MTQTGPTPVQRRATEPGGSRGSSVEALDRVGQTGLVRVAPAGRQYLPDSEFNPVLSRCYEAGLD